MKLSPIIIASILVAPSSTVSAAISNNCFIGPQNAACWVFVAVKAPIPRACFECNPGSYCNDNNKCISYPGENQPCLPNMCASDLTCDKGICKSATTLRCIDPTRIIMESINATYKTTRVTTRSVDVTGKKLLLDDFSTNGANNLAYQFACEDKGGTYVELHYDADCSTVGGNKTVGLFVNGQTRCYNKACKPTDTTKLFSELTLRPTEERATRDSNSKEQWQCTGQLRIASANLCLDKTNIINQKNDMRIVNADIQATVSSQKFLGMDKAAKLVTFSGADQNFKDACTRSGGVPRAVKNSGIVCGGKSVFEIQNFTICLWPLCGANTDADTRSVIAQQFRAKLIESKAKVADGSCVFSSAMRVCMGSAVFAITVVCTFAFSVL